jgi:hypothetical protein
LKFLNPSKLEAPITRILAHVLVSQPCGPEEKRSIQHFRALQFRTFEISLGPSAIKRREMRESTLNLHHMIVWVRGSGLDNIEE